MFDGYCLIQSPSTAVTLAPHGTHRPLAACARQASLGHAQVRCASPLRRTSAAQHRRNPPSRGLGLDFWVECSWLLVAPRCCNRLPRHHHHLFILEWKWSFVRKAPHRRAPLHATPSACKALATRGGEKHVRARCGCTLHSARCARLTMRSWQAEQDRLEAKQQVCRSPPPPATFPCVPQQWIADVPPCAERMGRKVDGTSDSVVASDGRAHADEPRLGCRCTSSRRRTASCASASRLSSCPLQRPRAPDRAESVQLRPAALSLPLARSVPAEIELWSSCCCLPWRRSWVLLA